MVAVKKVFLVSALLFVWFFSYAQGDLSNNSVRKYPVSIAYFGDFYFHPGIKVGAQYPLLIKKYEKHKRSGKIKYRERHLLSGLSLGYYHHTGLHNALFLTGEIGRRRILRSGVMFDYMYALGYERTFYPGKTFVVNDDNSIKKVPLAGGDYLFTGIALAMGKTRLIKRNQPFGWYIKQNVMLQIPYNNSFGVLWGVEFGATWWIDWPELLLKKS